MNFKKSIIAGLAALAVACPAIAANAATIGYSSQGADFYVSAGQETKVTVTLDNIALDVPCHEPHIMLDVTVTIPADALPEGAYTFTADSLLNNGENSSPELYNVYEALISSVFADDPDEIIDYDVFDFSFTNENGENVSPKGAIITINAQDYNHFYNIGFVMNEDGSLSSFPVTNNSGIYDMVPPHFSRFILAQVKHPDQFIIEDESAPEVDDPPAPQPITIPESTDTTVSNPQPKPDDKGANTGDNSSAFSAVIAVAALASLGIAAVARTRRKSD